VTPIDWTRLYVGRVLRLAPLYLTVMGALFVVVGILSGGSLREPATTLAKSAVKWLGFTVLGHPDLNGVDRTSTILAGVTWSLPYEWFFYLALPALGLLAGLRVPRAFAALSVCSLIGLVAWKPGPIHLAAFLGGLAAALAVRSARFRRLCTGRGASAATLVTLGTLVTCFDTAYHPAALLLLGGAFCLVAGGCTVFGLLTLDASRRLGEVTYGVYLLHGLTLFVVFRCVLGFEAAAALSSLGYWGLVVALTPILVLLCFIAFRTIEEPAMRRTQLVTQRLKSAASRRPSIHPH
jgi:peptidoglycan/LPS O-acetylase OafA/YrhL